MIEHFEFGKMIIKGQVFNSDLKIINGKVVDNWWRKQGHLVVLEDVEEILASQPEIIVIGQGSPGLLKVDSGLKALFRRRGIKLIEEPTPKAMLTFNQLVKARCKVDAGFHLTC